MLRKINFSLYCVSLKGARHTRPSHRADYPLSAPCQPSASQPKCFTGNIICRRFSRNIASGKSESKLRYKQQLTEKDFELLQPRRFVDNIILEVAGGKGGPGCYSFIRTRVITTGHADGGNGGAGGDIYFQAQPQKPQDLSYLKKVIIAGNEGKPGKRGQKNGFPGNPITVGVPVGTQVYKIKDVQVDGITKEKKILLTKRPLKAEEKVLVAKGGSGGLGSCDADYRPERQAGLEGQQIKLELVLNIPNDVSLIGFSGSGKTTLLGSITRVLSLISDQGLTSVHPTLGTLKFIDEKKLTILDLPPVHARNIDKLDSEPEPDNSTEEQMKSPYKYAHHIASSKLILVVLDATSPHLSEEVILLLKFIKEYKFEDKRVFFVINKKDELVEGEEDKIKAYFLKLRAPFALVSAKEGSGLSDVVAYLRKIVIGSPRS